MDLTVTICSYNRAPSLANTLASLERQVIPAGVTWEVVVVNNNSTDDTENVIAQFRSKGNLPLQYHFERRQGLSYARNAGIKKATGRIFAFTDDDCIADANWIACMLSEFKSDPLLSGLGGRVDLYDPRDKPVTIRPFKERIAFQSTAQLFYLVPGCNMAFRREVFDSIGGFDPHFGSVSGLVADDTDFIYRVFRDGFKLIYSPDVLVYHNHGRRTDEQVRRLNRSYIRGRGGFYCKHILSGDREVLKMAYWETRSLLKECFNNICRMRSPGEGMWVMANLAAGGLRELGNKCFFPLSRGSEGPLRTA